MSAGFFALRKEPGSEATMVPLSVATTWTRILSVTAGAASAIGAPGPATRVRGKAALSWIQGPWLGIFDFQGVKRCEREVLDPWLSRHAEPLLLVRHLLLARPLSDDVFVELTPQAREAMPDGWRDEPRPVLLLAPAGRSRPERRREYLDALSRLRIPLVSGGSELWAIREFDVDLLVALAQLADPRERAAFRTALDPGQVRLFEQQLPAAEAALLDDLVGARDEEGALALDMDGLSAMNPQAHPLAVYSAVERAHNRRRAEKDRTHFSARTLEARLSARGFPEAADPCTAAFEQRAEAIAPLLAGDLQRLYEANELLGLRREG
jgi:hypothetical protein